MPRSYRIERLADACILERHTAQHRHEPEAQFGLGKHIVMNSGSNFYSIDSPCAAERFALLYLNINHGPSSSLVSTSSCSLSLSVIASGH
jgi:hypothetical protein